LGPSVRAYIQFKCGRDNAAEADFHRERALKEKANRQLREILVEQTRGQLHPAEAVQFLVETGNDEIRSKLSAFGDRLALELAGKDPGQIKTLIEAGVRELLNELREYKPQWSKIALSSAGPPDAEPQPEKEPGRVGWKKVRPRPSASESNRKRWANDPEKLAETLQKMNNVPLAHPVSDESRRKMSNGQKRRWQSMPPAKRAVQMAKMRAARGKDFAKAGVEDSPGSEIT
jgi:hypothetical protein